MSQVEYFLGEFPHPLSCCASIKKGLTKALLVYLLFMLTPHRKLSDCETKSGEIQVQGRCCHFALWGMRIGLRFNVIPPSRSSLFGNDELVFPSEAISFYSFVDNGVEKGYGRSFGALD